MLCIVLMGLNTVGYYALLHLGKARQTRLAIQKIQDNAEELNGSMILRIPLTLPYTSSTEFFERANGEVQYEGEVYRFVKQRIYNDTLYIVCVQDHAGSRIREMIADYSKAFSNESQEQNSNTKLADSFAKYYLSHQDIVSHDPCVWQILETSDKAINLYAFNPAGYIFQPPRTIA